MMFGLCGVIHRLKTTFLEGGYVQFQCKIVIHEQMGGFHQVQALYAETNSSAAYRCLRNQSVKLEQTEACFLPSQIVNQNIL